MKKHLLSLLASFSFIMTQAQITITATNMPVSGDTCRYSTANTSDVSNYAATGANFNWSFSLTPTGQGIRKFQPSTQTPYFFYFLSPKYGEKIADSLPIPNIPGNPISIKNIYSFYKKVTTPASFNSEGLGLTMSGIPIGATYSDEDELYKFPLAYGNRDSTTFKLSTPSNSMIPFTYKKQGYRITEADGWGTITTPYGTAACLRVITTQYSMDTITISALPAGFNKFGIPNYMRSYQWLTASEKIPYLEVTGNVVGGNFAPTQVKYRDRARFIVGMKEEAFSPVLSVFPNPASDQLTIITTQQTETLSLEILDLQGKQVKHLLLDENHELVNKKSIDISGIAKGLYILNISGTSGKQSLKISIQ
jgi:hypothetical protein